MALEPSRPRGDHAFARAERVVAGTTKVGNYLVGPATGVRPSTVVWHPAAKAVGFAADATDGARIAAGLTLLGERDATIDDLRESLAHERAKPAAERLLQEIGACLTALSDLEERHEVHLCQRHLVRAIASLGSLVDVEFAVDAAGDDTDRPPVATEPPR